MLFFETIRVEDKKLSHLFYHQQRVDYTAKAFGFLPPNLCDIKVSHEGFYRLKVIYDKMGIKEYQFFPYTEKEIKHIEVVSTDIEYNYKYLDRDALNKLLKDGYDEVFIVKNGLITDSLIANLAFLTSSGWVTPKTPLLKGTTRQRLLDTGFLKECDIGPQMLKEFKGYAFMNAMIGFKQIQNLKIDGV